jgi:hypothetical protein
MTDDGAHARTPFSNTPCTHDLCLRPIATAPHGYEWVADRFAENSFALHSESIVVREVVSSILL